MNQNHLFVFSWEKCADGYVFLEKDPSVKKSKLQPSYHRMHPVKRTLFPKLQHNKGTRIRPSEVRYLKAKSNNRKGYEFYQKKHYGISRTFAEILKYDGSMINDDRLLKFTKAYGALGITASNNSEPLDEWLLWAQYFKRIYDYLDGDDVLDHARALTFYNDPPKRLFVMPRIIPNIDENSRSAVYKSQSFFYMQPFNLLAALYLDLGEQLTHGADLQKCSNPKCIKWFKRRSNKLHCGNACKTEKYRQKTSRAR